MQKHKAIDGDTENLISNSRRDLSQPKKDVLKGIHESNKVTVVKEGCLFIIFNVMCFWQN